MSRLLLRLVGRAFEVHRILGCSEVCCYRTERYVNSEEIKLIIAEDVAPQQSNTERGEDFYRYYTNTMCLI